MQTAHAERVRKPFETLPAEKEIIIAFLISEEIRRQAP